MTNIRHKINPKLHPLMQQDAPSHVALVDPWSLITPRRFDLMAKYLYGRHRKRGMEALWARELYDAHIQVFNGYVEADGSRKCGIGDFLTEFDTLLDSVERHGVDRNRSVVPVTMDGVALDGAHRIAAAAVFDKPVPITQVDTQTPDFGYTFFRDNGLKIKYLDAIAMAYCQAKANMFVVIIWPSAQGQEAALEEIIQAHGEIVYRREALFEDHGLLNLMRQVYTTEPWLGAPADGFSGAQNKADWCFQESGPLRAYLVSSDLQRILALKGRIRELYGIDNHSVHINDTHDEAIQLSQLLFSQPTIDFLNRASPRPLRWFTELFDQYRGWVDSAGIKRQHICVDGSAVMAAYGLREARDLDYICTDIGHPDSGFKEIGCHNDELAGHGINPAEWVVRPDRHFYFNGFKFATLERIRHYKQVRAEAKDMDDLVLIDSVTDGPVRPPRLGALLTELPQLLRPRTLLAKLRFIALKGRFHLTKLKKRLANNR